MQHQIFNNVQIMNNKEDSTIFSRKSNSPNFRMKNTLILE